MEFKRDELKFNIPDKITVRQQLTYFSEITNVSAEKDFMIRLWFGARSLFTNWECSLFSQDVDIETEDNPKVTELILWAALQVRDHMNSLDRIPKN